MAALDGILVIAIEQAVAAPLCTVRLADAGARVIKVEREGGETARNYDSAVHGTSAYFAWLNRGKESAVLDLKSESDKEILANMLRQADVVVQNLAPGALDRLGFDSEVLTRDFPDLIAVSIVGYGQNTPYADMKAYDMLVQAEAGLCAVTGTPKTPSKIGVSAADIATGSNAHAAILEALIERGRTGRGKSIEISMFDGIADWMSVPLLHYEHLGKETARYGLSHASIYPYRPFSCKDGTIIVAVQTNEEWRRLCRDALLRPDLLDSEQFATNSLRVDNRSVLDQELEPVFAALSFEEAVAACTKAGIAWAQYRSVAELANHPALARTKVDLPGGASATVPKPAGRSGDFSPGKVPGLGEHSEKIRGEFGSRANNLAPD